MTTSSPNSAKAWVVMFLVALFISSITLVVFGAFGGLILLLALNGFSESTGGMIIFAYAVVVLACNCLVAGLCNLLIARRWFVGMSRWSPFVAALLVTVGFAVVGPALAVLLIQLSAAR